MSKRKLLYITSVPGRRDLTPMSDATKSVLSVLSRDFEISLAVAGVFAARDLDYAAAAEEELGDFTAAGSDAVVSDVPAGEAVGLAATCPNQAHKKNPSPKEIWSP